MMLLLLLLLLLLCFPGGRPCGTEAIHVTRWVFEYGPSNGQLG